MVQDTGSLPLPQTQVAKNTISPLMSFKTRGRGGFRLSASPRARLVACTLTERSSLPRPTTIPGEASCALRFLFQQATRSHPYRHLAVQRFGKDPTNISSSGSTSRLARQQVRFFPWLCTTSRVERCIPQPTAWLSPYAGRSLTAGSATSSRTKRMHFPTSK